MGNFDHVFEQHARDVYRPLIERMLERDFFPIALHISGPLLEWLEAHDASYLDLIGRLAIDGKVEILSSGFYEPVLAALPRQDRLEQLSWMREAIHRRFGVEPAGLWLTERVWEPDLTADLAAAGLRFALVDDRHFLVSGFEREALHAPFWTESDGRRLALFPIDERLRYLVPFQPPAATATYLRELRAAGKRLAVLVDDGEKFGGWPGTKEWVYERGWLSQFLEAMSALVAEGEVRLSTLAAALAHVPSGGIAYLPTTSYREMEGWSLPPRAAARLAAIERDLGPERLAGPDGALVRGAHWKNFLVKYPESNRMHKKAQLLSALCRARGNPDGARRAIGRAQCNDAYWHGVFGGLYLPHLRNTIWQNLAAAERELRRDEGLAVERLDVDGDGLDEIWIHSAAVSAVVSPARGGVVEEYTLLERGINYADTLTRRREAYHELAAAGPADTSGSEHHASATPSIHDLEKGLHLDRLPPVDRDGRAMFVERVLAGELPLEAYAHGEYVALESWAGTGLIADVRQVGDAVEVVCGGTGGLLEKRVRFTASGGLSVTYRWDAAAFPAGSFFTSEISLARPVTVRSDPPAEIWSFRIATVSKSERGLDETVQGQSLTPRWPVALGGGRLELVPG
ncbi:MAG TPA: alpha-amylase/4-alpha-glucanotransferase domain-containing protein [Gemmatimonadales bacterium]|nr:alpha-amylase/4-alpha-glucanotransferase domain-containing protein [Gemmatimonadales bacterium]